MKGECVLSDRKRWLMSLRPFPAVKRHPGMPKWPLWSFLFLAADTTGLDLLNLMISKGSVWLALLQKTINEASCFFAHCWGKLHRNADTWPLRLSTDTFASDLLIYKLIHRWAGINIHLRSAKRLYFSLIHAYFCFICNSRLKQERWEGDADDKTNLKHHASVSQLPTSHSSTHNTTHLSVLACEYACVCLCRGPWTESETQTVSTHGEEDLVRRHSSCLSLPGCLSVDLTAHRTLSDWSKLHRSPDLSACVYWWAV